MAKRFVCKGVEGGWRIWDNKRKKYWGEHYELQPDEIADELNNRKRKEILDYLNTKFNETKR